MKVAPKLFAKLCKAVDLLVYVCNNRPIWSRPEEGPAVDQVLTLELLKPDASSNSALWKYSEDNGMDEEKQISESGEVADNSDYIATINQLKQNSVDRQKYDKLKAENKQLLDAIVNGQGAETVSQVKEVNIQDLRNRLFSTDNSLSNLEYVSTALELRDALIENGENDPFLPYGHKISPTNEDREAAERVAAVLKECVEEADGDSRIFTKELYRQIY